MAPLRSQAPVGKAALSYFFGTIRQAKSARTIQLLFLAGVIYPLIQLFAPGHRIHAAAEVCWLAPPQNREEMLEHPQILLLQEMLERATEI